MECDIFVSVLASLTCLILAESSFKFNPQICCLCFRFSVCLRHLYQSGFCCQNDNWFIRSGWIVRCDKCFSDLCNTKLLRTSVQFCLNTPSLMYNQTVIISYPSLGPSYNEATHTSLSFHVIVTKCLNVKVVTWNTSPFSFLNIRKCWHTCNCYCCFDIMTIMFVIFHLSVVKKKVALQFLLHVTCYKWFRGHSVLTPLYHVCHPHYHLRNCTICKCSFHRCFSLFNVQKITDKLWTWS